MPTPTISGHLVSFIRAALLVAAWVALGASGCTLSRSVHAAGLALAEDGTLASECGTACSPARASTLDALAVGADVALGLGAALAAVGVVLVIALPADGLARPRRAPLRACTSDRPGGRRRALLSALRTER